ncbi:ABC transporter permease [Kocuria turfanensis]|uniref:Putative peptide ABC transporter DppC n=1 Tax=Kocuria turfanensis TaxID=388357 RepID=A0A512IFU2_9MICC|nr:ABC transporter permease [Kocuria turfanensis]GEO96527.1 putative peptide ABC transporter DppC [Kocuria turfanensis]
MNESRTEILEEPTHEQGVHRESFSDRVDDRAEEIASAAAGGDIEQAGLWRDAWRQLRRNPFFIVGALLFLVFALMAVAPQVFTSVDPRECSLSRSGGAPQAGAPFGYDVQGCDYYANVVHGARVSLSIGFLAVLGTLVIGVVVGALAGYYGGWIDSVLARVTDIFYGLPLILGAIILLSVLPERGVLEVSLALIAFGWMTAMRLVRSNVIGVKEADYVQAARALGAGTGRIITKHILPNAMAPVLVYSTIAVGTIIASEATLTFLGVGLQLPEISWGLQINAAQNRLRDAPHLILFPSLFLSLTVLAFILMGDALRDALDPKLRR